MTGESSLIPGRVDAFSHCMPRAAVVFTAELEEFPNSLQYRQHQADLSCSLNLFKLKLLFRCKTDFSSLSI